MIIDQLNELEKVSKERGIPIIGREKGEWLLQKVKELKPKKVLELGTANGYSGIILGSEGAELTTIEIAEKAAEEAAENFAKFGTNAQIIVGDGAEVVKELNGTFDLIFLDFAKKKYLEVLDDCIRLGKVIIADNVTHEKCGNFLQVIKEKLKTEFIDIGDGMTCSEKI